LKIFLLKKKFKKKISEQNSLRLLMDRLGHCREAKKFSEKTTHIILGEDKKRTIKVLQGIVNGKKIKFKNHKKNSKITKKKK
jgi:hypothetical protein